MGSRSAGWHVLVPFRATTGKSRLVVPDRAAVAAAMTDDVVAAASVTPGVAEVRVVGGGAGSLDADLLRAAAEAPGHPVAVLMGDVPSVRPAELAAALALAALVPRAVVGDAEGHGTVLLTACPGPLLAPSYGAGSRQRHVGLGAVDLTERLGDAVAGLRCDVDTVADLDRAAALGVGPATRALLAGRPLP